MLRGVHQNFNKYHFELALAYFQYRQGGNALNGLNVQKTKELMESLGLPWDESDPYTVERYGGDS